MRDILIKARAYLARGWTQSAWARNAAGYPIDRAYPGQPQTKAVCWCSAGAIAEAIEAVEPTNPAFGTRMGAVIRFVEKVGVGVLAPAQSLTEWNDRYARTQTEVLALFDRAISACNPEPSVS